MSDLGDHARDLHHRAINWPATGRGPLTEALTATLERLEQLEQLPPAPSSQDPRDLLYLLTSQGLAMGGMGVTYPGAVTLAARALALVVAGDRAETRDPSSGSEAA